MSTGSGFTLLSWEMASGCSRTGSRRWHSSSSKPRRPVPASSSTSTSQQANRHPEPSTPAWSDRRRHGRRLRHLGADVLADANNAWWTPSGSTISSSTSPLPQGETAGLLPVLLPGRPPAARIVSALIQRIARLPGRALPAVGWVVVFATPDHDSVGAPRTTPRTADGELDDFTVGSSAR